MPETEITEEFKPQRLDVYVVEKHPNLTRSQVIKMIQDGKVLVNGAESKGGFKLRQTDKVTIDYTDPATIEIPDIDLTVIYEDDDCVVVNKPIGVLSHSKGAFNPEATVATWMQRRTEGLDGDRAGIVHRLDRATSGVMICAKTPEALAWLQKQFSQRRTKKMYVAIVHGHLKPSHAIIDMPIERNPKRPQTFHVNETGKPAQTEYIVTASSEEADMVKLMPMTGRTHQLRVHMKQLGHPILGDTFYGTDKKEKRLYLHAKSLEITLPSKQRRVFSAPLPKEFTMRYEWPK